ncbi:hypothetical protein HGRIS_002259 [Hohenbuehelia grisea]|uniref:Peroxin/Ferlin domain-containing protein n=1 Tax=Hohenbuehelia grisea TaxID=104357 RepID=A0ABR3JKN5_9AGAR
MSSLTNFLNTVPQPLTAALVALAPGIRVVRHALQIASWQSGAVYDSWLMLAAWWAICLGVRPVVLYFLPFAYFVGRIVLPAPKLPPPVTESALQNTIADLTTINALLPTLHLPPLAFRAAILLYLPYLILMRFVRTDIILGIVGTLILTQRATWATTLRGAVFRSAHIRVALYRAHDFLTGNTNEFAATAHSRAASDSTPTTSLRFLFTIYENQRWWVGLDWTAALLPAERPSWSSANLQPAAPPAAFTLPDDTTVIIPAPSKAHPRAFTRRTATWRWDEPEWRVTVRRSPDAVARVERPLPALKDESSSPTTSISMSRLVKFRDSISVSSSTSQDMPQEHNAGGDGIEHAGISSDADETDPLTDIDGWVYGDNKWEGQGPKGGLGKYTRFRRWTRIAVVEETVQYTEDGDIDAARAAIQTQHYTTPPLDPPGSPPRLVQPSPTLAAGTFARGSDPVPDLDDQLPAPSSVAPLAAGIAGSTKSKTTTTARPKEDHDDSPLRQRLKSALQRAGTHHAHHPSS